MKSNLISIITSALAMIAIIALATNLYHSQFNWISKKIYDIISWPKYLKQYSEFNLKEVLATIRSRDDDTTVDYLKNFKNREINSISTLKFDVQKKHWIQIKNRKVENSIGRLDSFKIVSYNIWFGSHNFFNRRIAILELLKNKDADVVCLQEVTSHFYNTLMEDQFIRENYYLSDSHFNSYNVVILSKFPMKFYILNLPSNMNRNLVIGELITQQSSKNSTLVFSSSHLESLENEDLRKTQLEKSFEVIKSFNNSLLVGDFNIDDTLQAAEMKNIDSQYQDNWLLWKNLYNLS